MRVWGKKWQPASFWVKGALGKNLTKEKDLTGEHKDNTKEADFEAE